MVKLVLLSLLLALLGAARNAPAQPASQPPAAVAFSAAAGQPVPALAVPRVQGRLHAAQLGLVINEDDPYSVAVGAYYQQQRGLSDEQVLRVRLPLKPRLDPAELETLRERIAQHFGPEIQALALAWRQPFAVNCNAITAAVTLGYQAAQCPDTCARGTASRYFNSASSRPFSQLSLRPSMLLAASDEAQARQLIDRGVAADGRLGRLFGPTSQAVFLSSTDTARNVRAPLFPAAGKVDALGLRITRAELSSLDKRVFDDVILVQTGTHLLRSLNRLDFLPGALADHLTSAGGFLDGSGGQSTALEWISAGATASYGTVSEPCNHLQKFPHPQLLLLHYLQGATAIEAYWKSVAWPAQGLFIGEPLAAPYARQ